MSDGYSERRRGSRIQCSIPIQLRPPGQSYFTSAEINDATVYGCYAKMLFPIAVGTVVDVRIGAGDSVIEAKGLIKTADPGLGNGVEFTGLSERQKLQLQGYLDGLPQVQAEPGTIIS